MLNFNTITVTFIILLTGMIGYHFYYHTPAIFFIGLVVVYVGLLSYGSSNVRSGFYVKTISSSKTKQKEIAISFDDGPSENYTPEILEILRAHKAPATFFCIGKRIEENGEILRMIHADGHLIGNHSYTHDLWFDLFSAQKMTAELKKTNELVKQTIGVDPKLFRPPYGVTTPNLKKAIKSERLTAVGWSIRSMDTVAKDAEKLLKKVTASLNPGAVILFHDTSKATVDILSRFLSMAKEKGYQIVPLDKLLNLEAYGKVV